MLNPLEMLPVLAIAISASPELEQAEHFEDEEPMNCSECSATELLEQFVGPQGQLLCVRCWLVEHYHLPKIYVENLVEDLTEFCQWEVDQEDLAKLVLQSIVPLAQVCANHYHHSTTNVTVTEPNPGPKCKPSSLNLEAELDSLIQTLISEIYVLV